MSKERGGHLEGGTMPSEIKAAGAPKDQAAISPLAGKPAPKEMLVDVGRLQQEYSERRPDVKDPNQMVSFGTSGHRGSSGNRPSNTFLAERLTPETLGKIPSLRGPQTELTGSM